MGRKWPSNHFQSPGMFNLRQNLILMSSLIHKAGFCIANVNLQVSSGLWRILYILYTVINTRDNVWTFGALFSSIIFTKQCSNNCNQMLDGKRVRKRNGLFHIVKKSQNSLVVGRFRSFYASCRSYFAPCRSFQDILGRFWMFLYRCKSCQVVPRVVKYFKKNLYWYLWYWEGWMLWKFWKLFM